MTAALNTEGTPTSWISDFPSPILVVPNDVILLAIVAPLSLALFREEPRRPLGVVAVISVFLSLIAIGVYQSRAALLTLLVAMCVFGGLIWPRFVLLGVSAVVAVTIAIDAALGLPMFSKFALVSEGRILLWFAARKILFLIAYAISTIFSKNILESIA